MLKIYIESNFNAVFWNTSLKYAYSNSVSPEKVGKNTLTHFHYQINKQAHSCRPEHWSMAFQHKTLLTFTSTIQLFFYFFPLASCFFSFAVEKIDNYFMPPLSPGEYVDECRNDPPITHIKLPELSCQCRWLCFFQTFSFKYFFFDSRIVIKQFPSETFYFCSLFNEWNKKLTSRNLRKKCGNIFNPKSESRYVIASASC